MTVSLNMQELDLYTFDHFKKVRALCNAAQKISFDELIHQIIGAVNNPNQPQMHPNQPPMPPNGQPMPPNPPQ